MVGVVGVVFAFFITVNGSPVGETHRIVALDSTCRQEMAQVVGLNLFNTAAKNGAWIYGSCEPAKQ